jgi:hypothetical protein
MNRFYFGSNARLILIALKIHLILHYALNIIRGVYVSILILFNILGIESGRFDVVALSRRFNTRQINF